MLVTGKIVEIHENDAHFSSRLIGKICRIEVVQQQNGFYSGWADVEGHVGRDYYFYGVKLEPCAPSEEQKCSQ